MDHGVMDKSISFLTTKKKNKLVSISDFFKTLDKLFNTAVYQ
jgi:hypothetical protein